MVEYILNDRPFTLVSDSPDDVKAISSNDLLLVKLAASLLFGIFSKDDCYVRRRWRHIQYIAGQFWKRWKEQYLHLIRTKFICRRYSPSNRSSKRASWVLARVEDVSKNGKGLQGTSCDSQIPVGYIPETYSQIVTYTRDSMTGYLVIY